MTWGMVAGLAVALALVSLVRYVRVFVWGFAVSLTALLLLHARDNPGEAAMALSALGGGAVMARPLRRWMTGGWI